MCAADATGHLLLGQFPGPPRWGGKKRTWWWPLHEGPPQPPCAVLQLGLTGHGSTTAGRRHSTGQQSTGHSQESRSTGQSWHGLRQSWGLGGESTAKPHSGNLNRVRQLIQHGCEGEHKHPALESSRTGRGSCGRRKEGKFPVTGTGQGRLSAVRAGEALTGCHGRGYKQNYHLLKRSESMRM